MIVIDRPGGTTRRTSYQSPSHRQDTAASADRRRRYRPTDKDGKATSKSDTSERANATHNKTNGKALNEDELQQLDRLKQTGCEVRQHQLAHQSTGDRFTGSIEYEYESGPDGQQYAVSGEVSIDSSSVPGDSNATIIKIKMGRIHAAPPPHSRHRTARSPPRPAST